MGHHEMDAVHSRIDFSAPLIGSPAPGFKSLAYFKGWGGEGVKEISLDDYKGKWLVMFFFTAAFTGICDSEVKAFSEEFEKFHAEGAEILGLSSDSVPVLKKLAESGEAGDVKYPLMTDSNHRAAVPYNVYDCETGLSYRGLYIINPEGKIMYVVQHFFAVGRSTDEALRVLQALKSGGACDVNWKKSSGAAV